MTDRRQPDDQPTAPAAPSWSPWAPRQAGQSSAPSSAAPPRPTPDPSGPQRIPAPWAPPSPWSAQPWAADLPASPPVRPDPYAPGPPPGYGQPDRSNFLPPAPPYPGAPAAVGFAPPQAHAIPDRAGRLGSALIGALVGAVVAALIAGAIVAGSREDADPVTAGTPTTVAAPGPNNTLAGTGLDIQGILISAQPSVVSIETGQELSPFGGAGSGFILTADGLIVTNNHVIQGADSIRVKFHDGAVADAELVGSFPDNDVAMVRVTDVSNLVPARLGSSDALQVGDDVVAIGNALNLGGQPSVTTGIVSGKDRLIEVPGVRLEHLIQTDAAINHGNSGGPLFNADGEVVGINTAIAEEAQNIGFAIAIDSVKTLIEELKAGNGEINPDNAFLGVRSVALDDPTLDPTLLDDYEITAEQGAVVVAVTPASAAAEAGLTEGDVIVRIDDTAITTSEEVSEVVRAHEPGDQIRVTFDRQGELITTTVTLRRRGG